MNHVRLMHETDLDAVLQIEQYSYPYPWTRNGFQNLLDQGVAFVICDDDSEMIFGYACFHKVLDECELMNFCIAEHARGKGIGASFLRRLLERLQDSGLRKVLLEVRVTNFVAKSLYSKLGFVEDGLRKHYYRNADGSKEDAVLMSLTFDQ
jgi:ribosomal-protein-alanine N-acetyltransferase